MERIEIMRISFPEKLFKKDTIVQEYKALAKKWHPDKNPGEDTSDIFAHIQELYQIGLDKIEKNSWGFENTLDIKDISGKEYVIRYIYKTTFELGLMYIGNTLVAYEFPKEYKKLLDNFQEVVYDFKYPMKDSKGLEKTLPKVKILLETMDSYILVLEKTAEVLPLRVLINYLGGKVEPKSMAWMMSGMHNLLCFLKFNGISHNAINSDTIFISPEYHSVLLLGGWWYARPVGKKLLGLPESTFSSITPKMRSEKIASVDIDSILVKALGREILGDRNGINLDSSIPKPIRDWVVLPGFVDPFKAYRMWSDVLTEAYGERKFIKMDVNTKEAFEKMPRRV